MRSTHRGCSRHAPTVAALVLGTLIATGTMPAQAADVVSNLGEPLAGNLSPLLSQWFAAPFVTDDASYRLDSVTFSIDPGQFPQEDVSFARIYEDDGAGGPGALLTELSNPSGLPFGPEGDYVFTATSAVMLEPATRYFVSLGSQVPPPGQADQRAYWEYTISTYSSGPGTMPGGTYFSGDQGASWSLIGPDWNAIFQVNTSASTPVPDRNASTFALGQNTPNPFNPRTVIQYELASDGLPTSLRIFDARGSLVRTLVDETEAAGTHRVTWDGRDASGEAVASGTYFYRLTVGTRSQTKKLIVLE